MKPNARSLTPAMITITAMIATAAVASGCRRPDNRKSTDYATETLAMAQKKAASGASYITIAGTVASIQNEDATLHSIRFRLRDDNGNDFYIQGDTNGIFPGKEAYVRADGYFEKALSKDGLPQIYVNQPVKVLASSPYKADLSQMMFPATYLIGAIGIAILLGVISAVAVLRNRAGHDTPNPFETEAEEMPIPLIALEPSRWVLTPIQGIAEKQPIPIWKPGCDGWVHVGRAPFDAEVSPAKDSVILILPHNKVSRYHIRLRPEADFVRLQLNGTPTNATMVNGRALTSEMQLYVGDKVTINGLILRLDYANLEESAYVDALFTQPEPATSEEYAPTEPLRDILITEDSWELDEQEFDTSALLIEEPYESQRAWSQFETRGTHFDPPQPNVRLDRTSRN